MQLIISNLNKTYGNGVQALKDVNLTINQGMFGLLGPNGAGKSSLMRTIATLQEPDSGSITLGEVNVLTQKDEVRKTLGYLPQEFGVYPKVDAKTIVCPITTNVKPEAEILRVHLKKGQLTKISDILVDQPRAIDNKRFINKLGKLTTEQINQLKDNLKIVLDL